MANRIVTTRTAGRAINRLLQTHQNSLQNPEILSAARPTTVERSTHVYSQLRWFSDSKAEKEGTAEEQTTEELKAGAEKAVEEEVKQPEPSKEEQLELQVKDLKDQVLRSLADQENTRRIAKADVTKARQFAIKSFAKSLLEVSDNLERAMKAVPKEVISDKKKHPELANLYEGIEMTEKGLLKAFEANGLQKYGKPGEVFDPNLHDALFNFPDPKQKSDTVGQVMKSGYKLNGRVLRPAEVGVVQNE